MKEFFGICAILAICCAVMLVLNGRERELSSLISAVIYVIAAVYVISQVDLLAKNCITLIENVKIFLPIKYILQAGGIAVFGAVTSSICEAVGQRGVSNAIDTITVIEMIFTFIPIGKSVIRELLEVLFE